VKIDHGCHANRVKEAGKASSSKIPAALRLNNCSKIPISVVMTNTPTLMNIS